MVIGSFNKFLGKEVFISLKNIKQFLADEINLDNNENYSGIKKMKNNHIKIITKRKEPNKSINKSNNEVLDLNNQYKDSTDIPKGNLTKHDLKGEIVNDYTDYLNQGLDDTTSNNQNDRSQPSMIYNHK